MRHALDFSARNLASALANHFREWMSRNERIHEVAIKAVCELSKLPEGDALVRLRLFSLVNGRT